MSQIKSDFSCFEGKVSYRETSSQDREVVSYYNNGQMAARYLIKDGYFHGMCTVWHRNGRIKRERPYSEGRLNGVVRSWHENGVLDARQIYRMGQQYGIWRYWDNEGKLYLTKIMVSVFFFGAGLLSYLEGLLTEDKLTAKDIIRVRNAELRRLLIEDMSYEKFVQQATPEILDRNGELELMRVSFRKDEEPLYLVKVRCPSTGAYYMLRVPPTMQSAKQSVAWTFGMNEDEYKPVKET